MKPELVIREGRHKMTWAMRPFFLDDEEQQKSLISLATTELHSDVTTNQRSRHWEVAQARHACHRDPVQLEHRTHSGTCGWPGQNSEGCAGAPHTPILNFREILYMLAKPAREGKWDPRFCLGIFVGMLNLSSEAVIVTEQGLAVKTRAANVRRSPESERCDACRILAMRAVLWSPDGSDNAFDIQVGMERPAEMVHCALGEILMDNNVARTSGQGRQLTAKHVGGEF